MSRRIAILATTAVLLVAIFSFGAYRNAKLHPDPTAANAAVTTGLSVMFDKPLQKNATILIKDSSGKQVAKQKLEAKAQRFNLALEAGVYQVELLSKDRPPAAQTLITVTDGKLSQINLATSHSLDERI